MFAVLLTFLDKYIGLGAQWIKPRMTHFLNKLSL